MQLRILARRSSGPLSEPRADLDPDRDRRGRFIGYELLHASLENVVNPARAGGRKVTLNSHTRQFFRASPRRRPPRAIDRGDLRPRQTSNCRLVTSVMVGGRTAPAVLTAKIHGLRSTCCPDWRFDAWCRRPGLVPQEFRGDFGTDPVFEDAAPWKTRIPAGLPRTG